MKPLLIAAVALALAVPAIAALPSELAPAQGALLGTCVNVTTFTAAAQSGVVPLTADGRTMLIQVASLELAPTAMLSVDAGNGTILEQPAVGQGDVWNLHGTVIGDLQSKVRLTISQIGLDGTILANGQQLNVEPVSEALASSPNEIRCSATSLLPLPLVADGISLASVSTVRTLIMLDSAFYTKHPCYTCTASNIYNRADTTMTQTNAGLTEYLKSVSTSAATDTSLGMSHSAGSSSSLLSAWAGVTAGRSDKSSWDHAVFFTGQTLFGDGADGRSYHPGRYALIFADVYPWTVDSATYNYVDGQLAAHEFGHGFNLADTYNDYWTYRDACHGTVYVAAVDHLCVGASERCDSPAVALPLSGSPYQYYCVGPVPQVQDVHHYYLMNTIANHDPATKQVWDTTLLASETSMVNACLFSWFGTPYSAGQQSC